MISVLLVDDQALMRSGLRMTIDGSSGIEIVGEAADGLEAIQLARSLAPDIVLMDIRMPRLDGIEATRRIVATGARTRVIVLTTFEDDEYVFESLRAGASGFLVKSVQPDELVKAIEVVASGDALLSPSVTRRLITEYARHAPAPRTSENLKLLTQRELDVVRLIALGQSNELIAKSLFVSEATVKTHVGHILGKLGLRDRVQVVIFAYESGIVVPGAQPKGD